MPDVIPAKAGIQCRTAPCSTPQLTDTKNDWESRVAALWQRLDSLPPAEFVPAIDALAAERPPDDATALFERACARDSTGEESGAETLYRAAIDSGRLDPYRQSRAVIQLASTLRILGQLDESERLLVSELDRHLEAGNRRALHDEARSRPGRPLRPPCPARRK